MCQHKMVPQIWHVIYFLIKLFSWVNFELNLPRKENMNTIFKFEVGQNIQGQISFLAISFQRDIPKE